MQDNYLSSSQKRSNTPTQRQKYNNYTPRKRYIKEQEDFSQYLENQQRLSLPVSPYFQINSQKAYKPHISSSSNKKRETYQLKPVERDYRKQTSSMNYDFSSPLKECSSSINTRLSLRKPKYPMNIDEDKNLSRLLNIETENINSCNVNVRTHRENHLVDQEPLTPRKFFKMNDNDGILTQKMIVLQQKITRLQKMNPKRYNTPKKSKVIEQTKYQLELEKQEKDTAVSSRVISERENELMSRVSLGRLVEQQQCENEIDVIQDLSYKISSKLQTIIRNFG